jgi:hypothetical protein
MAVTVWKTTGMLNVHIEGAPRDLSGYERLKVPLLVEVDLQKLAEILGQNALRNKSRKAVRLNGLIVVTAGRPTR